MTMKDLREKRAVVTAEMRSLNDAPAGDGGDLSDAQSQRFDVLKSELETLEGRIERQTLIDEADRREAGAPVAGTGDGRLDAACADYSLVRAIAGAAGMAVDDAREREFSTEIARRAGRAPGGFFAPMAIFRAPAPAETRAVTSATTGANLIATDLDGGQFIDLLRSALRVRGLGARTLAGLSGDLDIPRLKTSGTAGWVADNAGLTAADPTYEKVALKPKHAGALTEFSRNMLMQSSPDVEQLIRADFAAILAEAVDTVAIDGGGTNEPVGVLQTTGIGTVAMGTNGAAINWGAVIDLIAELDIDNAEGTGFLTNSKVVKSARKTAKVASTDSVMLMESPRELAGFPLASTSLVPANLTKGTGSNLSALLFGNWADLILGFWSELDILVNPYESTAYAKGNVQVRAMMTMDVAVRHPESFAAITDLIA